jgi:hypothetical protein
MGCGFVGEGRYGEVVELGWCICEMQV